MADPVCHATQGALMMVAPFISRLRKRVVLWALVCAGALLGDLPDLLGVYGFFVRNDHGEMYDSAHIGHISKVLVFIPMYGLHLSLDSIMHEYEKEPRLFTDWLWLEVLMWIMNIVLIYGFVRIWKRNMSKL
jgi:hypothetical protein